MRVDPRARVLRLAVVVVALAASLLVGPAAAIDVGGDDGADEYAGSGGLILPVGVDQGMREQVAGCAGCMWKVTGPCVHLPDEGAQVACMTVITGCPRGQVRLRAWFQEEAAGGWRDVGLVCVGGAGVHTVADVGRAAIEQFRQSLPPLRPASQPARGVLPYLPVAFDSGQPATVAPAARELLGHEVVLSPSAVYRWAFGDGQRLSTTLPGSRYPDLTVSHAYRTGGAMAVMLDVEWQATFTVDGLGPYLVPEPIHQGAMIRVSVGQARAVLVG